MGFVDLHLHILPGVDDGARTLEDSLAMARTLVRLGFDTATPSPHHRREFASSSRPLCETKLEELRGALAAERIPLTLVLSAENHFLEEGLLAAVGTPSARTIGTSKALLVEAPYSGPLPALPDLVFRMRLKGVTPVIAHPERCLEFEKRGRAAEAVRLGALLQLDLGSLVGRHGKPAQRLALELLGAGLYAVAATDAHGPGQLEGWLTSSLEALEKEAGSDAVRELLDRRPRSVLAGTI